MVNELCLGPARDDLGDFCQRIYQLACSFAQLLTFEAYAKVGKEYTGLRGHFVQIQGAITGA